MSKQEVILGDCLEVMKGFADKQFDLVLTDPPFGLDMGKAENHKQGKYGKQSNYHESSDWDSSIPSREYFDEIFRVSKNQIICGGNYFTDFLPARRCWIVWDKINDGFYSTSDGELIWTSFDSALRFFRRAHGMDKGFMTKKAGFGNVHPTQKPLELMRWLIGKFSNEGDTILDPFAGSGTTGVAAKQLKRDCTLIEISPKYVEIIKSRLSQESLF